MKTILVFGHEDLEYDNGAIKLVSFLKEKLHGYNIMKLDRPEQMMDFIGMEFIILDVARGIDSPVAIDDVDNLTYRRKMSAHDMDLASYLKMMKKLGEMDKVNIVALPYNCDPNKYKDEVLKLIKEFEM